MKVALLRRLGDPPPVDEAREAARTFTAFRNWCEENGVRHCPARPEAVAQFVLDHAPSGLETLGATVAAISGVHSQRGLANPTATWMVAAALRQVGDVAPPRSWPKAFKDRFAELPLPLKRYVAKHDAEREKVLRRAQNEAARAKRGLAEVSAPMVDQQKPGETDDGSDTQ